MSWTSQTHFHESVEVEGFIWHRWSHCSARGSGTQLWSTSVWQFSCYLRGCRRLRLGCAPTEINPPWWCKLWAHSCTDNQQVWTNRCCSLSGPVDICFQGRISIPVRQKERSVWASVLYRTSWSCLSPGFWAFTLTCKRKQDFSSSPASDILQLASTWTKNNSKWILKISSLIPQGWWSLSPSASLLCS